MIRLREGDRSAFRPVFDQVWPVVLGFCKKAMSEKEAEDVAQVALTKLFEQAPDYDEAHDVVAWALSIAAWEVRTERQRRVRRRETDLGSAEEPVAEDVENQMIRKLLAEEATRLLSTLTPQDQATLRIAFAEGSESGPTFRKRKQRALSRLRRAWRILYGAS